MKYKLNVNDNGDVKVKMKAGSCYVLTTKTKGEVVGIVEIAEKVEKASDNDFGICVDDGKFYIDGELELDDTEPEHESVGKQNKKG